METWNIRTKKHSSKCICSIESNIQSLVTSGIYERAFIYNGKNYPHIIDPTNGLPIDTDLISISILDNDSMKCDALSTPILLMGANKGISFMKEHNINGILITKNNELIANKSLFKHIKADKNLKTYSF